jgi:hypothetical protein
MEGTNNKIKTMKRQAYPTFRTSPAEYPRIPNGRWAQSL